MNHRKRSFALAALLCAVILPAAPALAQHGEHGQHEHTEAEVVEPNTYANALEVIHAQLEKIERLMATRQLDRVHAEAAVIRDVAGTLVRLALNKDSGVLRTAIRTINLTAKDLAAKFGPIDEAGDSGDLAGTRKVYDEMVALFATLEQYLPREYVCPMGCEPGKIYRAPGRCPVCGMSLKNITGQAYSVQVRPTGGAIEPGTPISLVFTIKDPAGAVVKNLEVVHEKELHLVMVLKDLSWFAHEHPRLQRDGTLRLTFTFPHPGEYVLFHDFTPAGVGMQVVPVTLRVEGTRPPPVALVADSTRVKEVDGYTVRIDTGGLVYAGREAVFTYTISRKGRDVTDLEPYLGAIGHLAIVSEDLKHFVHSHPLGEAHGGRGDHEDEEHGGGHHNEHAEHGGVAAGSDRSVVSFHARFPEAGLYKSWAQFKHYGRILTVPFVIDARPAAHDAGDDGHHGRQNHDH